MKVFRLYKNRLFYHAKPVQCDLRLSHPIPTTSAPPPLSSSSPKKSYDSFPWWDNEPQLLPQPTPQSPVQYRFCYWEPGWLTDLLIDICTHIQSMPSPQQHQVSFLKQALTTAHRADEMVKWCSLFPGWLEPWPSNGHKDHGSCPWKYCWGASTVTEKQVWCLPSWYAICYLTTSPNLSRIACCGLWSSHTIIIPSQRCLLLFHGK